MLTEKDYCDYDTCVALKKMGYTEKTLAYYTSEKFFHWNRAYIYDVSIPDLANSGNKKGYKHVVDAVSLWEAQKWLRKEKKIGVFASGFKNGYTFWVNNLLNGDTLYQGFFDNQTGEKYKSYEEALSEGIKEAIKLLKEEKNGNNRN